MDSKTCCVTGHRDIPVSKINAVKYSLYLEIQAAISDGYTQFISGFADGSDLLFAAIVAEEKQRNPALSLEAAIPYRGRIQTPNREFQRLLLVCNRVSVIRESYIPSCYMERNRYMVDHSQRVIAVYVSASMAAPFLPYGMSLPLAEMCGPFGFSAHTK